MTTALVPTLNVMSDQLVQLLQVNGLAIVTTDGRQPTEAQMQMNGPADNAEAPMDIDSGTNANQGV